MNELLILFGTLVLWIALNRWILPWFGISTCMSGNCATNCCPSCGPGPNTDSEAGTFESKGNQ